MKKVTSRRNGGASAPTHTETDTAVIDQEAPESRAKLVEESRQSLKPLLVADAAFTIRGTSPLVIQRFSVKAMLAMIKTQEAGTTARSKKGNRQPKDFEALWNDALYVSREGWYGFNAAAIRCGIIAVCRLVDFKMTMAKLSIWCVADGSDKLDHTPLVRITKGEPNKDVRPGRLANGSFDIKSRPMWEPGWEATVKLQWDRDQFTFDDVNSLMRRMGTQNGIGEGRMNSRQSNGCGWGSFEVVTCTRST